MIKPKLLMIIQVDQSTKSNTENGANNKYKIISKQSSWITETTDQQSIQFQ